MTRIPLDIDAELERIEQYFPKRGVGTVTQTQQGYREALTRLKENESISG